MPSYVRSDSVVSRVIAGEMLVIPIRRHVGDLASIYSLNAVATLIWNTLERPSSFEQIVERVQNEFCSESEPVRQDVERFLEEMCSLGLISSSAIGAAA